MMNRTARLQRIERRIHVLRQQRQKANVVYVDPVFFARQQLGFQPDGWQENVLSWTGSRLLLNCCRQSGKSTISAILALHQALYHPGSLTLLISPSLRQSSELFKKVTDWLAVLPVRPALTEDNRLSLRLQNGARIVSLPSKEATIRGFSGASLIIEDEASRVSDDLYLAIRPMLAVSNGRLILMSTPFGKRGHFFEAWENGGDTWERINITGYDCPRISAEFLAQEKREMPESWFLSEYMGAFTEIDDAVFLYDLVMTALDPDVVPLFGSPEGSPLGIQSNGVVPLFEGVSL